MAEGQDPIQQDEQESERGAMEEQASEVTTLAKQLIKAVRRQGTTSQQPGNQGESAEFYVPPNPPLSQSVKHLRLTGGRSRSRTKLM